MAAFMEVARMWANTVLIWIGFGTVVGLIAKAILPGKDQGGVVAVLLMGIGGSIVGLGTLAYLWHGHRATPVSIEGFLAALAGSSLLLFFHRVLQGSYFREGGTAIAPASKARRRPAVAGKHE